MNHTRLLHQEALKKPKHLRRWFNLFDFYIFLCSGYFFVLGGKTTVNCQLFGAFPTTSRFFFTSLQNSQAVNGSWLRPCRTLPWPKAAGGQVKRWWLLSMEFAGFLENLFVPLGGKVLNIWETTSGEGRSEARWFNDWLIKFVCVCVCVKEFFLVLYRLLKSCISWI